jgi:GNAT superfamily N-acetyltransferase
MPDALKERDVQLRDALLPADAAALETILRACKVFRQDEIDVALELIHDALARGPQSEYKFLVAASGERVLGYACYRKIACTLHSFDLCWIAVDPASQRLGIGQRLLHAVEHCIHLLGGSRVYVETSSKPQYEPTRRFYQHCGYHLECSLPDFYAPDDHKITLSKTLVV